MAKKKLGDHKRYRNSGTTTLVIEGKNIDPGDEFTASLEDNYETQMFTGGHLELIQDQTEEADQAQAEGADAAVTTATDTGNVVHEVEEDRPATRRSTRKS